MMWHSAHDTDPARNRATRMIARLWGRPMAQPPFGTIVPPIQAFSASGDESRRVVNPHGADIGRVKGTEWCDMVITVITVIEADEPLTDVREGEWRRLGGCPGRLEH